MDDRKLAELFKNRDTHALEETERQYGTYCRTIAGNILNSEQDVEECINDMYMQAWKSIPPDDPASMKAYLGRMTRNAAIDRSRRLTVEKHGKGVPELPISELADFIPSKLGVEEELDYAELREKLNSFVGSLEREDRILFVQRYWYMLEISDIAVRNGISKSKVKMRLLRTRKKLREYLIKEGYEL